MKPVSFFTEIHPSKAFIVNLVWTTDCIYLVNMKNITSKTITEISLCKPSTSVRGASLVASRFIKTDELVLSFLNLMPQKERTYQTIEIGMGWHVVEDEILAKLNHSCDPNIKIDTVRRECIARRDIREGEELSFFYPTTETEMISPFLCKCGSDFCIGYVDGATKIPDAFLSRYELSPHVQREIQRLKLS